MIAKLYKLYMDKDMNMLEINPLIKTAEGDFTLLMQNVVLMTVHFIAIQRLPNLEISQKKILLKEKQLNLV